MLLHFTTKERANRGRLDTMVCNVFQSTLTMTGAGLYREASADRGRQRDQADLERNGLPNVALSPQGALPIIPAHDG